ncbi:MAG: EAL domain-containing protein [Treponemataceae bacterium]
MIFIENKTKKVIYFGLPILLVAGLVVYYLLAFQNFLRTEMEQKITQENITRVKIVNQSIESVREIVYGFAQTISKTSGNFDTIIRTHTERYNSVMNFFVADKQVEYVYLARKIIPFAPVDTQYTGEDGDLRIDVIKEPDGELYFVFSMTITEAFAPTRYIVGCITSLKDQFPILIEPLFDDQGFSYIFSKDGSIFFDSDFFTNTKTYTDIYTKFEEEGMPEEIFSQVKELIQANTGGDFFYTVGKEKKLLRFLPLDFKDWFVLTSVPQFKLADQMIVMLKMTVFFVFLIAFYTAIVIIVLFKYLASSKKLFQKFLRTDPITKGMSLVEFKNFTKKYITSHSNSSMVIIGTDVIGFRIINDLYGFEKGNEILILIQEQIIKLLRGNGVCARSGADYFYIFVNTDKNKNFLNQFEKEFPKVINEKLEADNFEQRIKFISGAYTLTNETTDIEAILERVNYVHSEAHIQQKDSIFFYNEDIRLRALKISRIESKMVAAIKNKDFKVFLQPKYSLEDSKLIGAESLIRWQLTDTELLMPGEFIPVFETNGFIKDMDFYMLEEVCILIRSWIDASIMPVPVSVNQSKEVLMSEGYFENICQIIEKYNIPHELIDIEVTETFIYENSTIFTELIKKMRYYGFTISIGDFGSAYSSLCLVKDIPADIIKVARDFLYSAEKDSRSQVILEAIISMAKNLNMKVICEGIETQSQADILKTIHCYGGQGMKYGKPVSTTEFVPSYLENKANTSTDNKE